MTVDNGENQNTKEKFKGVWAHTNVFANYQWFCCLSNYKFTAVGPKNLENSFDCRCGIYCSNQACYNVELVMYKLLKLSK